MEIEKGINDSGEYLELLFTNRDLAIINILLVQDPARRIHLLLYREDFEKMKKGEHKEVFSPTMLGINADVSDIRIKRMLDFMEVIGSGAFDWKATRRLSEIYTSAFNDMREILTSKENITKKLEKLELVIIKVQESSQKI